MFECFFGKMFVATTIAIVLFFIWIHSYARQSHIQSKQQKQIFFWTRNLEYVEKSPWILHYLLRKDREEEMPLLSNTMAHGLMRRRKFLLPTFEAWKSETKRRKFVSRLKRFQGEEYATILLEKMFLKLKSNLLAKQRDFLLMTMRFHHEECEFLRAKLGESIPVTAATHPTTNEAFAEIQTAAVSRTGDFLAQNSTSDPPKAEVERKSKLRNSESQIEQIKEHDGTVAKLEFELQCKDTQLDILKREIANLKKSLVAGKRSSSATSIRNGMQRPSFLSSCFAVSLKPILFNSSI